MNSRDFNNLMKDANMYVYNNGEHLVATKQLRGRIVEFFISNHYEDMDNLTVGMWFANADSTTSFSIKTKNGLRKMMRLYAIL